MIEILPPLGKYKYDTWRILLVKCYINNFVSLQSCIRNVNKNRLSFTLSPKAELRSVATPELKCLSAMVNRIKYTPVADIINFFKNVHKMSGSIECTSMVTRIAMNLGCSKMANLA
jgi:hypothetical protein